MRGCPCPVYTRNMASCHFRLADLRRLVLTRASSPDALVPCAIREGLPMSCVHAKHGILPFSLGRPPSAGAYTGSCVHEKHDFVSFFLGKRCLLVLTRPSGPGAAVSYGMMHP